jgi:hypothetical protein
MHENCTLEMDYHVPESCIVRGRVSPKSVYKILCFYKHILVLANLFNHLAIT